jgi:hypothetical protein
MNNDKKYLNNVLDILKKNEEVLKKLEALKEDICLKLDLNENYIAATLGEFEGQLDIFNEVAMNMFELAKRVEALETKIIGREVLETKAIGRKIPGGDTIAASASI